MVWVDLGWLVIFVCVRMLSLFLTSFYLAMQACFLFIALPNVVRHVFRRVRDAATAAATTISVARIDVNGAVVATVLCLHGSYANIATS